MNYRSWVTEGVNLDDELGEDCAIGFHVYEDGTATIVSFVASESGMTRIRVKIRADQVRMLRDFLGVQP